MEEFFVVLLAAVMLGSGVLALRAAHRLGVFDRSSVSGDRGGV